MKKSTLASPLTPVTLEKSNQVGQTLLQCKQGDQIGLIFAHWAIVLFEFF
jgi:hypothetical protein